MKTKNMTTETRKVLVKRITMATLLICAVSLPLASCYGDKGTDPKDYAILNEIVIDTARLGIKPAYTIRQAEDILNISPKVYYNGEVVTDANISQYPLDFAWTLYLTTTSDQTARIDTLSTATSVNSLINRGANTYTLLFSVTDQNTKIQEYCSFSVVVESDISGGLMVLYENDEGNTDVGLIINPWVLRNSQSDKAMFGIYSAFNDEALQGKPVSIIHSLFFSTTPSEVLIASEHDYVAVSGVDFTKTFAARELFYTPPASMNVTAMGYAGNSGTAANFYYEWIINNGELTFTTGGTSRPNAGLLGDPMLNNYGEIGYVTTISNTSVNVLRCVIWDKTNRCFRYIGKNSNTAVTPFAEQSTANKNIFDVNNVGMDLVASDWGYGNGNNIHYEYSLMKEGNTYALLISNFSQATYTSNAVAVRKKEMTGFVDIDKATMIATGTKGAVMYYTSGDALYLCNPNHSSAAWTSGSEGRKVWSPPSENEKITYIGVHKNMHLSISNVLMDRNNTLLNVATWNETTKTGTVYLIPMDATNGALTADEAKIYPGFGKIKELAWKWAMIM